MGFPMTSIFQHGICAASHVHTFVPIHIKTKFILNIWHFFFQITQDTLPSQTTVMVNHKAFEWLYLKAFKDVFGGEILKFVFKFYFDIYTF